MKFSIIQFPGSNCDADCHYVLTGLCQTKADYVWHGDSELPVTDAVVLPGGFAHGDYLRCGAMAARSPIMNAVIDFAKKGGLVIGICNGFQVLCESGLLPGTLVRNQNLQFICDDVALQVVNHSSRFTKLYQSQEAVSMPVAHGEGHYYIDEAGLKDLQANQQIIFTYTDNPNGSVADIAGIQNQSGNVLGMMPHPERAAETVLGGSDGIKLFQSILAGA